MSSSLRFRLLLRDHVKRGPLGPPECLVRRHHNIATTAVCTVIEPPPFYACFSSERTSCTSLAYPWRDWFNFTANRCRRCVIAVKLSPLGPLSAPLGTGLPRSRLPRCQLSPRCLGRYPKPHKPLDTAILLACLSLLQTVSLPAPVMPSML